MNIAKAYYKGFRAASRSPRMLFLIYGTNLVLAVLVAIPFYFTMNTAAGHSRGLLALVSDFDFTVMSDIFRNTAEALSTIKTQTITIAAAFFILSVFFVGGILQTIQQEQFKVSSFFKYSGISLFRFLLLNAVMLVGHAIWFLIIAGILSFINNMVIDSINSEWTFYYINGGIALLYVLGVLFLLMVSDYGKFFLHIRKSHNFLKGSWKGLGFVLRHFGKTYTLFFLLILLPVVVVLLYYWVETKIEVSTALGLIILFLVQQAFIFLRVWFRVWIFGSQFKLYEDDSEKDKAKKLALKAKKQQEGSGSEATNSTNSAGKEGQ